MTKRKQLFEINEEDEFSDKSFPAEVQEPSKISGLGIVEDTKELDEENAAVLEELLASINSIDEAQIADDLRRQEEEREEYRKEEEARLAVATQKYNKERYRKEQEAKAERERLAAEEAARIEEEKRTREENSVFGKTKKFLQETAEKAKNFKDNVKDKASSIKPPTIKKPATPFDKPEKELKQGAVAPDDFPDNIPEDAIPESYEERIADVEQGPVTEDTPSKPEKPKKESSLFDLFSKKEKQTKIVSEKPKKEKPAKTKPTKEKPVSEDPSIAADGEPDWKYIATHDKMTGTLNTYAYAEALKTMPKNLAVVFFDINNLKFTNDNYSHDAGNRMITGVVESIKKNFGTENLYRIGGDEFVCLISKTNRSTADQIQEKMSCIHDELKELSRKDPEKVVYSVSIGYAIGDNKHEINDVVKAADASMYRNKKAYKQAHPELTARKEELPQPAEEVEPDYEDCLTKEQKQLRKRVQDRHSQVSSFSTKSIVKQIQARMDEVEGILIASPTFDHLFIIMDVNEFIDLILSENALIDYSYLYVIYDGGPQYYGADEYYKEVTHLFEDITEAIQSGKFRSASDIKSIKGINIFKNIYV